MNLVIPAVGTTAGPQYATDLNASLEIIDSHNHSSGSGVPITPSGLSISSDLSFLSNNATLLRSVRFTTQASPLALVTDLGCLYESGVDLYYNDGNGNQVRITQSGGVAGTPGSISGLVAPASVTYTPANQTFTFQSAALTSGNIDVGSVVIRNVVASSFGVTLSAPSTLAANYTLTQPVGLPGSNARLYATSGGVEAWELAYDAIIGSAAQVTAGTATHSTWASAIAAVSAQGTIKVNKGAWTENVSINKELNIIGSGYRTQLTGTLSFVAASYCVVKGINFSGNLSFDSSSNGNTITECFTGASATQTDNGAGNYLELIAG